MNKIKYKILGDSIEDGAINQFKKCLNMKGCIQGFLAPDSHLGYTAPIGSVLKFKDYVSPQLVGYDIGCGVACLELNINYKLINLIQLKTYILENIPLGLNRHKKNQNTSLLDFYGTSQKLQDIFSIKGKKQLGTLGSGNHFIEVGYLESNDNIAIVIHSGSRGLGHSVASHYMKESATIGSENDWSQLSKEFEIDFANRNKLFLKNNPDKYKSAILKFLDKQKTKYFKKQSIDGNYSLQLNSDIGREYMIDQSFCLEYALLNRKHMIDSITSGIYEQLELNIDIRVNFINRNHNHAEELDDGIVIHRKGATHAEKGMLGIIPGNMRDGSFIVKGKGNAESMSSSSHGAGRVLSRSKARTTLCIDDFKKETNKLVTNHTDKMIDESPEAYKDIFEVMKIQSDLVEIVDRVIPILNIKG
ncbi:MAG: RtcB family protein [Sulfurimonas sp.]|nr:RtcB family protein [Sulfurimonas sp.]